MSEEEPQEVQTPEPGSLEEQAQFDAFELSEALELIRETREKDPSKTQVGMWDPDLGENAQRELRLMGYRVKMKENGRVLISWKYRIEPRS